MPLTGARAELDLQEIQVATQIGLQDVLREHPVVGDLRPEGPVSRAIKNPPVLSGDF